MRRRYVIGLMLMLISSPRQLNGAGTKDRNRITSYSSRPTASATTDDVAAAAAVAGNDEKSRQLDDVLSSLEAAFRFMIDEAALLNLDAIIGTRIVEGRFQCQHFPFNSIYIYTVFRKKVIYLFLPYISHSFWANFTKLSVNIGK